MGFTEAFTPAKTDRNSPVPAGADRQRNSIRHEEHRVGAVLTGTRIPGRSSVLAGELASRPHSFANAFFGAVAEVFIGKFGEGEEAFHDLGIFL
ncbi:MAG: hypothetical protein ACI9OD_004811 [Limisphaerales bacterium]|jgi:hypothetical protein